jgi:hypothetical protein
MDMAVAYTTANSHTSNFLHFLSTIHNSRYIPKAGQSSGRLRGGARMHGGWQKYGVVGSRSAVKKRTKQNQTFTLLLSALVGYDVRISSAW